MFESIIKIKFFYYFTQGKSKNTKKICFQISIRPQEFD